MRHLRHLTDAVIAASCVLIIAALFTFPAVIAQTPPPTNYDQLQDWMGTWNSVRIQYSLPNNGTVEAGSSFQVPVQISYSENPWYYTGALDTYNVTVHIVQRPIGWASYGSDVSTTTDYSRVRAVLQCADAGPAWQGLQCPGYTSLEGVGYSHTFTIIAPQELGNYDVYVTWCTAWQAQDFIGGLTGPTHVDAGSKEWNILDWSIPLLGFTTILAPGILSIGVDGVPNGVSVTVDGNGDTVANAAYLELPLSVGQHTIQAPSVVPLGQGIQAVFTGWSDGTTANPRSIYFDGTGMRIAAQYQTQFYLQVDSNYGTVQGGGWYNANAYATVTASTPFLDPHVLDHWEGDSSGNNPQVTVLMDGPKSVNAVYRSDYSKLMLLLSIFVSSSICGSLIILRSRRQKQTRKMQKQTGKSTEAAVHSPVLAAQKRVDQTGTQTSVLDQTRQMKRCIRCGREYSAYFLTCPHCDVSPVDERKLASQQNRVEALGLRKEVPEIGSRRPEEQEPRNTLVLRATAGAEREVGEDPNLGSLSVLEAYVNNSPERKIVDYERVKQLPTGGKVNENDTALITGQIVLFLVLSPDDLDARYRIKGVKNLGAIPKEVRINAGLQPPLDTAIKIIPSKRASVELGRRIDTEAQSKALPMQPERRHRPAGSGTTARMLDLRRELKEAFDAAIRYQKAHDAQKAIRNYLLAANILTELRELMPEAEDRASVDKEIREIKNRASNLEKPVQEPVSTQSADKMFLAEKPNVTWNDIVGLEEAKRAIENSIIYPMKRPDLYPLGWPRGILLFGPPGSGKTLLAAAVAHEVDAAFFNVDAANVISKWVGDSERNIAGLFRAARVKEKDRPSIIFVDEIDSLAGQRDWEAPYDVRMKNQFLKEMDSLLDKGRMSRVYVIGATNKPWSLDDAFKRRFQKRIYIPLPSSKSRMELIQKYLQNIVIAEGTHLAQIVTETEGYSASDIRDLFLDLQETVARETITTDRLGPRDITFEDFRKTLNKRKPSVTVEMLRQYEDWTAKYGASS